MHTKSILPKTDPLWKAAKHEVAMRRPGTVDPRAEEAVRLADQVTEMLETGGQIQLRGKDGKLHVVKIQGLE